MKNNRLRYFLAYSFLMLFFTSSAYSMRRRRCRVMGENDPFYQRRLEETDRLFAYWAATPRFDSFLERDFFNQCLERRGNVFIRRRQPEEKPKSYYPGFSGVHVPSEPIFDESENEEDGRGKKILVSVGVIAVLGVVYYFLIHRRRLKKS